MLEHHLHVDRFRGTLAENWDIRTNFLTQFCHSLEGPLRMLVVALLLGGDATSMEHQNLPKSLTSRKNIEEYFAKMA